MLTMYGQVVSHVKETYTMDDIFAETDGKLSLSARSSIMVPGKIVNERWIKRGDVQPFMRNMSSPEMSSQDYWSLLVSVSPPLGMDKDWNIAKPLV